MIVPFVKYHGTGNDFIIIDQTNQMYIAPDQYPLIKILCDRHFGIGADGLMLLESSSTDAFHMRYYNADGNPSTMCGNGGRCIAQFAHNLGMLGVEDVFTASDGKHSVMFSSQNNQVNLQLKDVNQVTKLSETDYFLDTGSPHYVRFCSELPIDIVGEARSIRYNDVYRQEGVNVNFAKLMVTSGHIMIATYERGVEDETLSCGTGATAVALASTIHLGLASPVKLLTKGGMLSVSFNKRNGGFTDVWLSGPAVKVFEGTINIDHLT